MEILGVLEQTIHVDHRLTSLDLEPGDFMLIPASVAVTIRTHPGAKFLRVRAG